MGDAINLEDKLDRIDAYWTPRIVAAFNGHDVRLSKLEGEYVWHAHADSDELFLVIRGDLELQLRDGAVRLGPGEMFVVPAGAEHKPIAHTEVHALVLNRSGEPTTGDATPEARTHTELDRI